MAETCSKMTCYIPLTIVLVLQLMFCNMIFSAPVERRVYYTGHQVLRATISNRTQLQLVFYLQESGLYDVELWSEPVVYGMVDMRVSPDDVTKVSSLLTAANVTFYTLIQDVEKLIEQEMEVTSLSDDVTEAEDEMTMSAAGGRRRLSRSLTSIGQGRQRSCRTGESTFRLFSIVGQYVRYKDMLEWFTLAESCYPHIAEVIELGKSYESRPLSIIKIGKVQQHEKPAIWIDAGIHAREWIATSTAIYLIDKLVTGYLQDDNITQLVDLYDWYIMPVVNPDGYEYSHTTDRLWRKTRSRTVWRQSRCRGVDANRNFDFHWREHCEMDWNGRCGSMNPCRGTFAGEQPFSEPETRAMRNFLFEHRDRLKIYVSFHSYSQLWLTPWAYTTDQPSDYGNLTKLARMATESLTSIHGTTFTVGSPALLMYSVGGGSFDWAKGVAAIKYSYTLELRDLGKHGFLLPESEILPSGEETWQAMLTLASQVATAEKLTIPVPSSTDLPLQQ